METMSILAENGQVVKDASKPPTEASGTFFECGIEPVRQAFVACRRRRSVEQGQVDKRGGGAVRLKTRQPHIAPPRTALQAFAETGFRVWQCPRILERDDRLFIEAVAEHGKRQKPFQPIFADSQLAGGFADTAQFAAR